MEIGFLDELGRELDDAAGRLIRAERQARRRTVLPAAAVALLAAAAVAAWPSPPMDPEREVVAPLTGAAGDLVGLLAPARRPATAEDSSAWVRTAVRSLDRDPAFRLNEANARVLRSVGGGGYVLVAPASMEHPRGRKTVACLYRIEPDGTGGGGCFTAQMIRDGQAMGSSGSITHGVVPDGVASVRVRWADHPEATAAVEDNLFVTEGPEMLPPVGVTFLDARGDVIAVHQGP